MSNQVLVAVGSPIGAFLVISVIIAATKNELVRPEFASKYEQDTNEQEDHDSDSDLTPIISCARCHGKRHADGFPWTDSFDVWASRDPHATAFETLRSPQSKKIVRALAGRGISSSNDDLQQDRQYQEILAQNCIPCHSTVQKQNATRELSFSDGVNCQSCHGAAGKWEKLHAKRNEWAAMSVCDKKNLGFRNLEGNLKALAVRASTCIKCHIGSPGSDVNHDLIAAGHPRLEFEFSSYQQELPKHWKEVEIEHFHAKCWSIGQIESARSRLSLLRHRALSVVRSDTPWPEFAEYTCLNCHHDLGGSQYLAADLAKKQLGQFTWGTQFFPEHNPIELNQLRNEMSSLNPDPSKVVRLCDKIESQLPDAEIDDASYEILMKKIQTRFMPQVDEGSEP